MSITRPNRATAAPAGGSRSRCILALAASLALFSGAGAPAVSAATVVATLVPVVSPASPTLYTGASQAFVATSTKGVTWHVDGILKGNATVGQIVGSGDAITYVAPATPGTHTIKAVSTYNTVYTGSTTIKVVAKPGESASLAPSSGAAAPAASAATVVATLVPVVSPASPTLYTGASQAFVATSTKGVTWHVDGILKGNATVGKIVGSGDAITYVAPATPGTHTIKAVSTYNTVYTGSTTIKVVAKPAVSISVSPTSIAMSTGTTSSLVAKVAGTTNTAVTWSVDGVAGGNKTIGNLAASGLSATYTAPSTSGSHVITVKSAADTTKSANVSISVLAPAITLALNPTTASLRSGGTLSISAAVSGTSNTAVTWAVDGVAGGNALVGTLTGSGNTVTYTAPTAAGSHAITATSAANSAIKATTAITVQPPSTVAVTLLNAGPNSINASGSAFLTASVTGTTNQAVTWSVDGIASGNSTVGTIIASGNRALYVAPASSGSHTVSATSVADATKRASVPLTVGSVAYTILNSSKVFNVKTGYGAKGDGIADDTAAIQNALNAASSTGGGVVLIPAGTYMINPLRHTEYGLLPRSNTTLQFAPGATLKTITTPSSLSAYYIIYLNQVSNVNLIGPGILVGDRATRTAPTEYGMGVGIGGPCNNIVITDLTIKDCTGDGIYVGAGTALSTNVTVYGVTCTGNRRQGMTINCVNGMVVRDSTFSNTSGTDPQCGLDIEPEPGQHVSNVNIFNCAFNNNAGGGIQCGPADSNITTASFATSAIAFNTFSGNGNWGIRIQDCTGNILAANKVVSTQKGTHAAGLGFQIRAFATYLKVDGNTITGCSSDGMYLSNCSGTTVSNNTVTANAGNGIKNLSSGVTLINNSVSGNGLLP